MGEVAGKAEGRDGEKGRWRSGQVRGGKVGMLKQGSGRSLLSTGIGNTALDQLLAPLAEPGNREDTSREGGEGFTSICDTPESSCF